MFLTDYKFGKCSHTITAKLEGVYIKKKTKHNNLPKVAKQTGLKIILKVLKEIVTATWMEGSEEVSTPCIWIQHFWVVQKWGERSKIIFSHRVGPRISRQLSRSSLVHASLFFECFFHSLGKYVWVTAMGVPETVMWYKITSWLVNIKKGVIHCHFISQIECLIAEDRNAVEGIENITVSLWKHPYKLYKVKGKTLRGLNKAARSVIWWRAGAVAGNKTANLKVA